MKMVDFFAGVGCFSAAGHAAGFETIAALEINQAAADCYARHFPEVPNLGDINAAAPPTADLWTGGFPCQDLSPAGGRAGLDGKRSGLIWRFLKLADALRPRWILLENSTGLLTVARGRNAWRLFAALDDIGYLGAWRVMDSRYFGIPQGRRRVFILARDSRADGPDPAEVLFDGEGGGGDAATGGEKGAPVAGRAGARPGIARTIDTRPCQRLDPGATGASFVVGAFNAETITSSENRSGVTPHAPTLSTRGLGSVIGTLNVGQAGQQVSPLNRSGNASTLDTTGKAAVIGSFNADMIGITPPRENSISPTLNTGGGGSIYGITPQAIDGPGTHENMAPTIGTRNRAGVCSGYFVRRFTPLECERIQGIPDGWTAGQSDARRYHQIGNACPPPMIEWILRRLKELSGNAG